MPAPTSLGSMIHRLRFPTNRSRATLALIGCLAIVAALPARAQDARLSGRTVPVFANGQAQIVPGFADSAQWIREELWVETTFDSDGDGKRDRMHVDVTRPRQTATEGLKVPVVYESS